MAELTRFERADLLVRLISERPGGCSAAGLLTLTRGIANLTESTMRRDLDEMASLGWVEAQGKRWFIGPRLGMYSNAYIRRLNKKFNDFINANTGEESHE